MKSAMNEITPTSSHWIDSNAKGRKMSSRPFFIFLDLPCHNPDLSTFLWRDEKLEATRSKQTIGLKVLPVLIDPPIQQNMR